MINIKDFNKTLNSSYNNNIRFRLWQEYRRQLTDYILRYDISNKSVLMVGAGNLNDIDMSKILARTNDITLLDIDSDSILDGLKRQNTSNKDINIIEYDLTQLDINDFMIEFKESIIRDKTDDFFDKYNNHELNYNLKEFDVIIVLPIYTQILFHQMSSIINDNGLLNDALSFVGALLGKINNQLIKLIKEKGHAIVLSDVLEYKSNTKESIYLVDNIEDKDIVDKFYQDYLSNYGYSLGSFGLHDIEVKLKYIDDEYLMWPFDENRNLLVRIVILKKDNNQ